jgi:hypothetical protein
MDRRLSTHRAGVAGALAWGRRPLTTSVLAEHEMVDLQLENWGLGAWHPCSEQHTSQSSILGSKHGLLLSPWTVTSYRKRLGLAAWHSQQDGRDTQSQIRYNMGTPWFNSHLLIGQLAVSTFCSYNKQPYNILVGHTLTYLPIIFSG